MTLIFRNVIRAHCPLCGWTGYVHPGKDALPTICPACGDGKWKPSEWKSCVGEGG